MRSRDQEIYTNFYLKGMEESKKAIASRVSGQEKR
jgi:hypothetical protein